MKRQLTFPLLFCAALLLSACSGVAQAAPATATSPAAAPALDAVVAEGSLVPAQEMVLAFPAGGRVLEVAAAEGDTVQAGDVLARLEGSEALLAQQAAADLEIIETRQALDDLETDTLLALSLASAELESAQKDYDTAENAWSGKNAADPTEFDTALINYIEAETTVREAQEKVNDEAGQPKDSPSRQQADDDLLREQARRAEAYAALLTDYENPQEGSQTGARTTLLKAITRLETARARLSDLNGGADPDLRALLDARLAAAQAARDAAQEGLSALEIRAPWAGVLVLWDLVVGEVALPGQPVGALADFSAWFVETTDLTENGVVLISTGDEVEITVDALPGEAFNGVIESIQGKGEKYQGDMTYKARIRMTQHDPRWYWNMNVKVTIPIKD